MQRRSSCSFWRRGLRPSWIVLAVGLVLLVTVSTARSQERKALSSPVYSVLHSFTGGADGAFPNNGGTGGQGLTRDSAGNLYGVATEGGDLTRCTGFNPGCGIVYEVGAHGKQRCYTLLLDQMEQIPERFRCETIGETSTALRCRAVLVRRSRPGWCSS